MAKKALQLYSIKEMMAENVKTALKQTKKAGYEGVEFAGYYDVNSAQMKDFLDEIQLFVCGTHSMDALSEDKFDEIISYNRIIGNSNIVIPFISEEFRKTAQDWKNTARVFSEAGKKFKDEGFTLAYHNHSFEFEKFDTVSGYQILAENINPDYVKLQPDLGWVAFSGEDVEAFLETYKELIVNIHVKQFKKVGSHDATEIHKGIVSYPPIIKKCMDLGIDWFIIEQEGYDIPVLDSIKENCTELDKMIKQ